ncbi:MAG: YkgJ family cysteine cluster protein [Verrucomicrobiales bacterium]|nr:YkgJ family cysteine cluster protein [Verrucomicrobiales bacterium]
MPIFYECQRCTACCRWPGQVRVEASEVTRIAEFLGLAEREFIERHTRLRTDRRGLSLLERADGACEFLDGLDCRLQAVKPQQCRDFPNRWSFEGFEKFCRAIPRELEPGEYAEKVRAATGFPPASGGGETVGLRAKIAIDRTGVA